ncbi:MAG: SIS domain-containing protein [Magnetospirillum sp. WYHS-4]
MGYAATFMLQAAEIAGRIDTALIEEMVVILKELRAADGRLFLVGVGGSAANCSHAVNDFRKLCDIEAYTPVDNVSELTARTNDDGWESVFANWLKGSRAKAKDALMVFSVGGGNLERNVSPNIVRAIQEAKARGMKVLGVVGRDGGYTKQAGDAVVVVPTVDAATVTPQSEAFQAVVWHCLVSHPDLAVQKAHWESLEKK